MKLVILLILFAVTPAWAQIVIGNGGGLGEMQIIYFHQNLGGYLKPCLSPGACGITDLDRAQLAEVVNHEAAEQLVPVEFVTTSLGAAPFETARDWGAKIEVHSPALYTADGTPKAAGEIGAVLLAARWAHVNHTKSLEQLHSLSRTIFVGMNFSKRSKQLLAAPGFLAIHNYNFEFNSQSTQAIFIEDEKKSLDVSPMIQALVPCGEIGSWSFTNWRGESGSTNAIFIADARSNCSPGNNFLLSVSVVFDRAGLVRPDATRAQLKAGF